MDVRMRTNPRGNFTDETISLLFAWPGQAFRVAELDCGEMAARRLTELGMVPGARVEVLRSGRFGSLIVKVDSCRLGLGRGLAAKVLLAPVAATPGRS